MKIFVKVKPGSGKNKIEKIGENRYLISVKEPAAEGRANQAAVRALAKYFSVSVAQVVIIKGHASRQKVVEIRSDKV